MTVIPIQNKTIPIVCCSLIFCFEGSIVPEIMERIIKSNPVAKNESNPKEKRREPRMAVEKMIKGRSKLFKSKAPMRAKAPSNTGLIQVGTDVIVAVILKMVNPKLMPEKAPNPNKIHFHKHPDNPAPISPNAPVPINMIRSKLPLKL